MYQFYMNDEDGGIVQVYNDGEITEEYARHKIDNLTGGKSEEFSPVCLSLNIYDFAQAILPFSVNDEVMGIWKFHNQSMLLSRTYKDSAIEPYYAVDVVNNTDKVDFRGI